MDDNLNDDNLNIIFKIFEIIEENKFKITEKEYIDICNFLQLAFENKNINLDFLHTKLLVLNFKVRFLINRYDNIIIKYKEENTKYKKILYKIKIFNLCFYTQIIIYIFILNFLI